MVAWPDGQALAEWVSPGQVSVARRDLFEVIVEATIDTMWHDLDPGKMPDQDDPEPSKRCPASVALAVLILAARIETRRQSTNGVVASGELFFRVSRDDPDYWKLIRRYAVSAEP